jgi:hypothetical protein
MKVRSWSTSISVLMRLLLGAAGRVGPFITPND